MPITPEEATDQTVAEYFDALRAMDADRWVATFAPDAISNDPVGTPPLHGHEALRAFVTGVFSLFASFGLIENNVFLAGNTAAVKWTGKGKGKNGATVTFEGIDVITVDDSGKIILVNAYWDPNPILAAVQR
jgi:steroid Delta-isomerase